MPQFAQETLFGEREESYGTLTIENGELFPYIRVMNTLVDEGKLDATEDGFYVRAVDPANVGLVEASLSVEHDLPEFTVGVPLDFLHSLLGNKPRDATLELEFSRPYGSLRATHGDWRLAERVGYIPEDSVRKRPDRDPLELDLPVSAAVDIGPLASYITTREEDAGFRFRVDDGELFVGQPADTTEYSSYIRTDVDSDVTVSSIFSPDYLEDIFNGLRAVGVETATINLGDQFPITVEFSTENIEGTYCLAPRVKS